MLAACPQCTRAGLPYLPAAVTTMYQNDNGQRPATPTGREARAV
jgi:hypothetical protein